MISIADAVADLYTGEPGDFVARRRTWVARAKEAGAPEVAKAVGALRKPTLAASHVNRLDDPTLDAVLALGRELRAAQTRLDADAMKDITTRRQRLLHDAVTTLGLSGSVSEEVRATLLAATADTGAADAVASRALVRALHYSGWGDVDLGDALAHQDATRKGRAALRVVGSEGGTAASQGSEGSPDDDPSASSSVSSSAGAQVIPLREDQGAETGAADAAAHLLAAERARANERAERLRREAQREVERLQVRMRAAQAAVDAASAARDAAREALSAAQGRLDALDPPTR